MIWHRRLGHPSNKVLDSIVKRCNLSYKINEKSKFCEVCQFGKARALLFPNFVSCVSCKFDLVHTDLWGPTPINFVKGFIYYILFLDDFSRFIWIYPLKQKSEAYAAFQHFTALVQTQFGKTIKAL